MTLRITENVSLVQLLTKQIKSPNPNQAKPSTEDHLRDTTAQINQSEPHREQCSIFEVKTLLWYRMVW